MRRTSRTKRSDTQKPAKSEPPHKERVYLAKNVRRARQAQRLSQKQLADLSGLTQKWISKIELGRANPGIDTIAAVGRALGKAVHELVGPPSKK